MLVFAETLVQAAAEIVLPYFRTSHAVENKFDAGFDPVTLADKRAEQVMRKLIKSRYPEHGILGEEYGEDSGTSRLTWVLDPIDGTRAFITGLPLWGTLIALNDGNRPVLGIMNQPFTGERFTGTLSESRLGNQPIRTRKCARLEDAILMSTSPELFDIPARKAVFDRLASKSRMTRFGGDCYAYCMLAMGLVDIVIEDNLKPYDVQALIPIVEGAGGRMTAWDGSTAQNGGAIVACGDAELHGLLVAELGVAFAR